MPDQAGRQIEQQFIDQAFAQQRAVQLETGLGMYLVDAAPAQGG